ncbi:ribonuclease J [Helicobacter sp. MIT 99-5507]|uniref:ribonuclease J n=1 Tax=Helicobacter sp. MIT 99-5507 TaxID=152489 RepID=UPI000E1EC59A|nr:ribonuclease J [Helicobacter sp. MIT 99-5507]RDU58042.1 ribonuclease J [Helicobacter sp. MIT 99-5507]
MEESNNETNEIKQEQTSTDSENNHKKRPFKRWKRKDDNKDSQKKDRKEYFKNTEMQDGVSGISEGLNEKSNLGLHKDLKKVVELNNKNHKNTLNPHYKLDLKTKAKIRITPLGGLGEIGGNITVIESQDSAIVVDAGMSFPESNMHGVDILVPDFSYLHAIKDKIAGLIITHAHEDHIGAVPHLFKQLQMPIYGTPLPLGMIGNKFDECGLKKFRSCFRIVEKRKPIKIGDFEIEWIHITHSVIDASALAIKTQAGVILHTGDFKIDHTPVDNFPTDLHRLAYYGENGIMLMLSDSTNSHRAGYTPSESSVGPSFENVFKNTQDRIIMSTFSSNIHRVYQAISYGLQFNRKICVIGRSMEKNLEIARQLGYINIPQNAFIDAHEVEKYSDNEVLIVTTGSQGETMSALYRMATDEHRHIKIKPTDTIIISAKPIPGNEGNVSKVINFLMKSGAKVAYQDFSEIHVSGHAAQEEQKLMLRLIKPKFFLPIHGEYNHLAKHKETAIKCGVLEKNILLMEDGDQIEVCPNYIKKIRSVKNGKLFIDNQLGKIVDNITVLDRQKLAEDGIIIINMQMKDSKLVDNPRIQTFGLLGDKEEKIFIKELDDAIKLYISNAKPESINKNLEGNLKNYLRKIAFKKFKKYPTIVLNIYFL